MVTTISDTFLKGISTRRLVGNLRRLAPRAIIVMTGEERTDMEDLLRAGADHVLIPGEITGERILELLRRGDADGAPRRAPSAAGAERRAAPALEHRELRDRLARELGDAASPAGRAASPPRPPRGRAGRAASAARAPGPRPAW